MFTSSPKKRTTANTAIEIDKPRLVRRLLPFTSKEHRFNGD